MAIDLPRLVFAALMAAGLVLSAVAQELDPIGDDELLELHITQACGTLREQGKLVPCATLVAQAATAKTFAQAPTTEQVLPLEPTHVYELVRRSVRIVGHYYLCTKCDEWHFSGASGFCVGKDGIVATCAHVTAADETMREAFLVVADLQGHVWPVERVLANDEGADLAVLKTPESDCVPLALRGGVRVGERVYCLSNPDHQFGFFSEGIVARWFAQRDPVPEGETEKPADQVTPRPWLHVTCDFAKGSSGAPIVDCRGNVVGIAQATTTVVYDEEADVVDTQMVFKTATPAKALAALLPAPKADTKGADHR